MSEPLWDDVLDAEVLMARTGRTDSRTWTAVEIGRVLGREPRAGRQLVQRALRAGEIPPAAFPGQRTAEQVARWTDAQVLAYVAEDVRRRRERVEAREGATPAERRQKANQARYARAARQRARERALAGSTPSASHPAAQSQERAS